MLGARWSFHTILHIEAVFMQQGFPSNDKELWIYPELELELEHTDMLSDSSLWLLLFSPRAV